MGKSVIAGFFFVACILLLSISVFADADIDEGQRLVDQKADCGQLTEKQLEQIGDYYMEQMHPGEEHERMEEMMGGEGSEQLRQAHLHMAQQMHCEGNGMMPVMNDQGDMPMMNNGGEMSMMNNGMMGGSSWSGGWWGFVMLIFVSFVFSVVFWWTYRWVVGNKKSKR